MTRVTVWNEYVTEQEDANANDVYPDGIHSAIEDGLGTRGFDVRTATLHDPDQGLSDTTIERTDVLVWFGHQAHEEVDDRVTDSVVEAVRDGMGFIPLHSAHFAKPFKRLMGTSCALKWRGVGERERLWIVEPGHPIAAGMETEYLELASAEMFGERFDVPQPDTTVFISWFEGGEVFRSGCCYTRGGGRIFYFRPGHETYPIYHDEDILDVLGNAVEWARPTAGPEPRFEGIYERPLEAIDGYPVPPE